MGTFIYSHAQTCNGSLTVTIDGSSTAEVLSGTESHTDLACHANNGAPTGAIDITPTGGTAPYTFDWGDITGTDDGEDRTALEAGSYSVTITDANNCTFEIGPIVLTQPTEITVTDMLTQLDCNSASGAPTGAIDITPTGGTIATDYTYSWATTDGSGLVATDQNQSGLSAGTYNVTITDDNNCTVTGTYILTEPVAVVCSASSPTQGSGGTNILCNGGTGSIEVVGSGGTAPLEYSIDGTNFQTSSTFANIVAGSYTVTTKDAKGCTSTCTVELTEPTPLAAGSCNYIQDLCQLGDGEIRIETSGGVAPYNVAWSATPVAPNTTAGALDQPSPQTISTSGGAVTFTGAEGNNQYNFIVTDANGCQIQ